MGGGLPLSKIKSHLMLEQLVLEQKAFPRFKNRQIHFRDLLFSLVAAWQPVLMSQAAWPGCHSLWKWADVWDNVFRRCPFSPLPHPPPLHQPATCSEAALLCTRQGRSLVKRGWVWHRGIQRDSRERRRTTPRLEWEREWHRVYSRNHKIILSFPLAATKEMLAQ